MPKQNDGLMHPLNKVELIRYGITKRTDRLWNYVDYLRRKGWTDTQRWRWYTEKVGRLEQWLVELR